MFREVDVWRGRCVEREGYTVYTVYSKDREREKRERRRCLEREGDSDREREIKMWRERGRLRKTDGLHARFQSSWWNLNEKLI
jgi:hypothetical protein